MQDYFEDTILGKLRKTLICFEEEVNIDAF